PAGNTGATKDVTWTVDTVGPTVTVTASPANPTNVTSASFTFNASEAGCSFQCALDAGAFAACASPQAYAGPLADGSHTFHVKATDPAGNTGATTDVTWTVDTVPPIVSLTGGPADPTNSTSASFTFVADKAGCAFQCALDAGAF